MDFSKLSQEIYYCTVCKVHSQVSVSGKSQVRGRGFVHRTRVLCNKFNRHSFICQTTSTRRQWRDLFGLGVKLPPDTTSLITQKVETILLSFLPKDTTSKPVSLSSHQWWSKITKLQDQDHLFFKIKTAFFKDHQIIKPRPLA